MKKISVVLPIFNEEGNIIPIFERLSSIFSKLKYELEVIFVNDGSTDSSGNKIKVLSERDKRIVYIELSRNFGHELAVMAGIDAAVADAVIVMDSDMQDPPEICSELIKEWECGYDIVYAQRQSRKSDSFLKSFTAKMFYKILNILADTDIPPDTGNFRIMDKKVVESLKKFREHNRFMRGLSAYVGFAQKAVKFDRIERHTGKTKYSIPKMVKLSFDALIGFSSVPLKLIGYFGLLISFLSLLGIIYSIMSKFIYHNAISGWTSITIAVFFLGGVQMLVLGVIGAYVGRVYDEVRNRPLYLIREIKRNANTPQ